MGAGRRIEGVEFLVLGAHKDATVSRRYGREDSVTCGGHRKAGYDGASHSIKGIDLAVEGSEIDVAAVERRGSEGRSAEGDREAGDRGAARRIEGVEII